MIKNDFQIPESWFADKIIRLDEYSGGIEELTSKIANIRTWTYISHQINWIENNQYWQKKTRDIENKLTIYKRIAERYNLLIQWKKTTIIKIAK